MNHIPTAEEFVLQHNSKGVDLEWVYVTKEAMIEFAKLHVEAALEAASERAELAAYEALWELPEEFTEPEKYVRDDLGNITAIDVQSILKAYPLTNIK